MPKTRAEINKAYRLRNKERLKVLWKAWYSENKHILKEKWKAYYHRVPEKQKLWGWKARMKRRYGLTLERYKEMLHNQLGVCAICLGGGKLSVDHCHKTKNVRGLLCDPCNNLLGRAKDSPATLQRAIHYLEKYKFSV